MTRFGQCWVAPVFAPVSGYNWAFLYWLLLVIFAAATFVIINARKRLSRGLRDTYEARTKSFWQGVIALLAHGAFWLGVAVFYWASLPYSTAPSTNGAAWVFCLLFSMRGLSTAIAWRLNAGSLSAIAEQEARLAAAGGKYGKVNRQLQPHLNLALRREILHYTTLAIRISVLNCLPKARVMDMVNVMREHLTRSRAVAAAGDASGFAFGNSSSSSSGAAGAGGGGGRSGGAGSPAGRGLPHTTSHFSSFNPLHGAAAGGLGGAGAVPVAGLGGMAHDADLAVAAGAAIAPLNDVNSDTSDEDLVYDWRPTNISLMASLFEGGGPLDLGGFVQRTGSSSGVGASGAKAPGRASTAAPAGNGGAQGQGQGRRPLSMGAGGRRGSFPGAAAAAAGLDEEGAAHLGAGMPTSASDGGVIKRPPLELRDLAPAAFGRIRDLFGVSPAQFFYSLSRTTKERFSEGASGAFMCFSHDMRFVLKVSPPSGL